MQKLFLSLAVLAGVYLLVKSLLAAIRIYSESRKTYYHALIFNLEKNFFDKEIVFELRELNKLLQSHWGQYYYEELVKVFHKNNWLELMDNCPKSLNHKLYMANVLSLTNFLHEFLDEKNEEHRKTLKNTRQFLRQTFSLFLKCKVFEIKHRGYQGSITVIVDDLDHFVLNLDDLTLYQQKHVLEQSNLIKANEILLHDKLNFVKKVQALFQKEIAYVVKKGLIKNPLAIFKIRIFQ